MARESGGPLLPRLCSLRYFFADRSKQQPKERETWCVRVPRIVSRNGLVPQSELGTIDGMKREAAEILKDALELPTEARAALAGSLLDSLDTEVDEEAEAAWAAEVNRRVAELDGGAAKTVPWAEVRRRLAAR